jgi:hypothetical protein
MTAAHPSPRPRPSDPLGRRSAGLHRVRGVTRWTALASAVSALLLGLGYAHALPDPAALLPSHSSDGGGGFTQGTGDSGGGAQPPAQSGAGGGHTTTGAS